jgi:FlaA1/EpsC-like NDP-sugar epimerase
MRRLWTRQRGREYRNRILASADLAAWAAGLTVATVGRFDFSWSPVNEAGLLTALALAALTQVTFGTVCGLYLGRWKVACFEELSAVAAAVAVTAVVLTAAVLVLPGPQLVPRSVPVLAAALALVGMLATRWLWRSAEQRRRRPSGDGVDPVVVLGAGESGQQVIRAMLRDPASPWLPVALLDDDPATRRLTIMGVPVLGGRDDLPAVARVRGARAVVIAVPSAGGELVREVAALAASADLEVRVVPPVSELLGPVGVADIRQVTDADLLGRHEISTDVAAIAGYLRGRRVLVTGAGGSIGSELCRQIAAFGPANLIMVDRDESALHEVQLSIEGRAMLDSDDLVLLDLRDRDGLVRLLRQRRPEVVFHAAALKHLPLLERHPGEAVKSNVWVTANLLAAAAEVGVERFVNISTDKAADPASVLGWSKRLGERLTADVARWGEGRYMSVRFGNVLGSRGSVLRAFRAQIEAGGPVTVTHPEVTRYFMTVQEAVQLVIQAGAVGGGGDALVLDMGTPVRIDEVARRLIERSGRDVEIVYTGLRPGEKLHEVLFAQSEQPDCRPMHPLISHVPVPPLELPAVQVLDPTLPPAEVAADLVALCGAFLTQPAAPSGWPGSNPVIDLDELDLDQLDLDQLDLDQPADDRASISVTTPAGRGPAPSLEGP